MTAEELEMALQEMRDLGAAYDEASGFAPLDADDYREVAQAIGGTDESEMRRALAWLCLMKQTPRPGRWSPATEIQGYVRRSEENP